MSVILIVAICLPTIMIIVVLSRIDTGEKWCIKPNPSSMNLVGMACCTHMEYEICKTSENP